MKTLLLFAILALPTTSFANDNYVCTAKCLKVSGQEPQIKLLAELAPVTAETKTGSWDEIKTQWAVKCHKQGGNRLADSFRRQSNWVNPMETFALGILPPTAKNSCHLKSTSEATMDDNDGEIQFNTISR